MAEKPAKGREHEPGAEDQPGGAHERIGPLAIARHVKHDGRALILYSEAPPPRQQEPPPA